MINALLRKAHWPRLLVDKNTPESSLWKNRTLPASND
jgi:hypothetical protein